jgi:hypothetical protein
MEKLVDKFKVRKNGVITLIVIGESRLTLLRQDAELISIPS